VLRKPFVSPKNAWTIPLLFLAGGTQCQCLRTPHDPPSLQAGDSPLPISRKRRMSKLGGKSALGGEYRRGADLGTAPASEADSRLGGHPTPSQKQNSAPHCRPAPERWSAISLPVVG
jgi:hypothetical protein